jgi:hypothetical protein
MYLQLSLVDVWLRTIGWSAQELLMCGWLVPRCFVGAKDREWGKEGREQVVGMGMYVCTYIRMTDDGQTVQADRCGQFSWTGNSDGGQFLWTYCN